MKKVTLITIFLLSFSTLFAQKFEKINALKTAFITDRMDFNSKDAEKFWPIYNKYEKEIHQYQVLDKIAIYEKINGKNNNLSEKEASAFLQEILDLNEKVAQTEKAKYQALKKIMTSQEILKLIRVEEAFKRQLFKLLQGQKKNNK
jgi:hypothetical protein